MHRLPAKAEAYRCRIKGELKAAIAKVQTAERTVRKFQEVLYELDGPLHGRGYELIEGLQ
jgi:hypothetical protein